MTPFTIEYRHQGKTRIMRFHADDFEDAEAQARSAYHNGEVQQVIATMAANEVNKMRFNGWAMGSMFLAGFFLSTILTGFLT